MVMRSDGDEPFVSKQITHLLRWCSCEEDERDSHLQSREGGCARTVTFPDSVCWKETDSDFIKPNANWKRRNENLESLVPSYQNPPPKTMAGKVELTVISVW
jgi:hypothetical protein